MRTAADEGAAVEGRLEADVAEVVVVVEVEIHRPVHLEAFGGRLSFSDVCQ